MTMNKTKLGDVISAKYGDSAVVGTIVMFDGSGYIHLEFAEPQDLGIRIEDKGVCIHPSDRWSVKVLKAGPELTEEQVGMFPTSCVGGIYLRK